MKSTSYQATELIPVEDYKICNLLRPKDKKDKFEASGVCVKNNTYYVIFDNLRKAAKIEELVNDGHNNKLKKTEGFDDEDFEGYEDITCNWNTGDFYLLIEAQQHQSSWKSKIIQCNTKFKRCKASWVDGIEVEGSEHNKGLEGLSWINREGTDYLLVLHERTGTIYVCWHQDDQWVHKTQLELPPSVQFDDYSCLDIKDSRIAVVSQESAKLWVGQLHDSGWGFVDEGKIYSFPDDYCNIEGVAWKTSSRIVAVSDKAKKKEQPEACQRLDQSIHIFDLPPT